MWNPLTLTYFERDIRRHPLSLLYRVQDLHDVFRAE